jgi:hypothetical protein
MTFAQRLGALLPILNSTNWTRDDAHALLDAALDIADAPNNAEGEAGRLAQAAALALSRAVAGWMVPVEHSPAEWDRMAVEEPVKWREEVIERMRLTYGFLPQSAVDTIMFAFINLNVGKQSMILEPKPASQARRFSRHALEQAMLVWMEMEKTRGRPALQAEAEVAESVGLSRRAVETWRSQWRGRDGRDRVEAVMLAAQACVQGIEIVPPVPDELALICFMTPRFMQLPNDTPAKALAIVKALTKTEAVNGIEAVKALKDLLGATKNARPEELRYLELADGSPLKMWIVLLSLAYSWLAEKN